MEIAAILRKIFLIVVFLPLPALAYSEKTTHPALTNAIVALFQEAYQSPIISDDDRARIVKGSIEEDEDLRFMRHFYDPIHDRGLTKLTGRKKTPWLGAPEWGKYSYDQIMLGIHWWKSKDTNYSYDRAVFDYTEGRKERAFESLGHVLHLIEDMTVPDHVRDDPHPPFFGLGSPYEKWTEQFASIEVDDTYISDLPESMSKIEKDYFHIFKETALFTNQNFFSKDTIFDSAYAKPTIDYFKAETLKDGRQMLVAYHVIDGKKPVRIARVVKRLNLMTGTVSPYYHITDPESRILRDMWGVLSLRAMRAGVLMVAQFFREAGEERRLVRRELPEMPEEKQVAEIVKKPQIEEGPGESEHILIPVELSTLKEQKKFLYTLPQFVDIRPEAGTILAIEAQPVLVEPPIAESGSTTPQQNGITQTSGEEQTATSTATTTLLIQTLKKVIIADTIYIPEGTQLVIEPGTIYKFRHDGGIIVYGDLIARGTEEEPIVFTSYYDDEYGGDTDGSDYRVSRGEWSRIEIKNTSKASVIDHAVIRYGGYVNYRSAGERGPLIVERASATVTNSLIEYFEGYGINLRHSSSTISSNTIRYDDPNHCLGGLLIFYGAPIVSQNLFSNNCHGIYAVQSDAAVIGNTFENNYFQSVVQLYRPGGYYLNNNGSGNRRNGIALIESIGFKDQETRLRLNPGFPYLFDFYSSYIRASSTLLIDPGVMLKFRDQPLYVYGRIESHGTPENPVIFTSVFDDSDGNDATNDGGASQVPNIGRGLEFYSGSEYSFPNTIFRYFGNKAPITTP